MAEEKKEVNAEPKAETKAEPIKEAKPQPQEAPAPKAEAPAAAAEATPAAAAEAAPAAAPAPAAKEEKKAEKPVKVRPENCAGCNKSVKKKRWYYRAGKFYCTKRCWITAKKKAEKPAEGAAAETK